jgi:hypothetical protein
MRESAKNVVNMLFFLNCTNFILLCLSFFSKNLVVFSILW